MNLHSHTSSSSSSSPSSSSPPRPSACFRSSVGEEEERFAEPRLWQATAPGRPLTSRAACSSLPPTTPLAAENQSLDLHISRSGKDKFGMKMSDSSDDGAVRQLQFRAGAEPLSVCPRCCRPHSGQASRTSRRSETRLSELKLPSFTLFSFFNPFLTLYASSCIPAELHAHATITIDGRRRARRRLDTLQPMGVQVSGRLRLSTNSAAALTRRRARRALSGFPRLTSPRDCFFKVAPRRLARASRRTHTTHTPLEPLSLLDLCV